MKFKNKLLTLIPVATIAATIAPLSSCALLSVIGTSFLYGYKPSVERATWTDNKATKAEMQEYYVKQIHDNPKIFAQDLYWSSSVETWFTIDKEKVASGVVVTPVLMEGLARNIDSHKQTCSYVEEGLTKQITYDTIDYDYRFLYSFDSKGGSANVDIEADYEVNFRFRNIPIVINRTGPNTNSNVDTDVSVGPTTNLRWFVNNGFEPFYRHLEQTDWVLQPLIGCSYNGSAIENIDYLAFNRLTDNKIDWKFECSINSTVKSYDHISSEPKVQTSELSGTLNKPEQFKNAISNSASLDAVLVNYLYKSYVPSYHLSNIVDTNKQIWG